MRAAVAFPARDGGLVRRTGARAARHHGLDDAARAGAGAAPGAGDRGGGGRHDCTRLGEGYPRELAGVTRGLNALLESERNRIARYRDTLGNLAHGLKTPLAVIRASSVLTSRQAGEARAAQRRTRRRRMQLEIDRMAQIVEHQLKRARPGGGVTLGQAAVSVLPR